ncbi:hypothetical protein PIB30_107019, partial [Stylosanthes scabra]|nr:hypothetical protein [Stylosanthes scabra]
MEAKELNLVWDFLYKEISECVSSGDVKHVRRILSVLGSAVKVQNGQKVSDYKPMLELVRLLVGTFIKPDGFVESQEDLHLVVNEILELMVIILNGLCSYNSSMISQCALQWAPVFKSRSSCLTDFMRQLLQRELCALAFGRDVLRAINDLMERSEEEAVYLLQYFCEKMQLSTKKLDFLDGTGVEALASLSKRLQRAISNWIVKINDISHTSVSEDNKIDEKGMPLLLGIVNCYSHMSIVEANPSLLLNLMDAIDQLLTVKADYIDSTRKAWESIIGSSLSSYSRLYSYSRIVTDETGRFLTLAK